MSKGLKAFYICLAIVFAFNIIAGLIWVPFSALVVTSIFATFIAVGVPIYAMFRGAEDEWTPVKSCLYLAGGVGLQVLCYFIARFVMTHSPIGTLIVLALGQVGLICWCLGFGALVAALIKDKNLILPITGCLALLDIFLVMTPVGLTQIVMKAAPKVLPAVALKVPQFATAPTHAHIGTLAYVGPADLLFIAMFFVALHRYGLKAKQTLIAMIPTLIVYLLIVIFFGSVSLGRLSLGSLPALPVIGLVVLLANLHEFKLNRDETISTAVLLVLLAGVVVWGMTRPLPPPKGDTIEVVRQGDISKPLIPDKR